MTVTSTIPLVCMLILFFERSVSNCRIPWTGEWVESDREMVISEDALGILGTCIAKNNDQYLLSSQTNRGVCYRCLIIFPVHENVLQYKSTQCIFDSTMTLSKCRSQFSGDSTMHTLFRKNAPSVPCPIDVPLNFTYYTSEGTCSSRTSSINRCAQWNRFSIRYQACPEIPNKEVSVSELECIATWHFLGHTFFAARVGGRRGEAFRCFITEKTGTMGRIGISADAGCQELTHIGAASVILHYKHDLDIYPQCEFPSYFHGYSEKHSWESMVKGTRHEINQGMLISSYKGRNDTVWTCIEKKEAEQGNFIRAHVRKGCQTGYQCMLIKKRKKNLIQIDYGSISSHEYEDCTEMITESRDTLVLRGSKEVCPFQRSHISPLCSLPVLWMGCEEKDEMHMLRECRENKGERFSCVAHFPHEEYQFFVVRSEETKKTQCLTYISTPVMLLRVFDHISCDPISIQGALPALQMNISSIGKCESSSLLAGFLYYSRNNHSTHYHLTVLFLISIIRMKFT